jgi:hypothetical protein
MKKTERNTSEIVEGYEKTCTNCWQNILSATPVNESYSILTKHKEFAPGCSLYLTKYGIDFFCTLEKIFKSCQPSLDNKNALLCIINTVNDQMIPFEFNECHGIKQILIERFIQFRLHSLNKKTNSHVLVLEQSKVPKSNPSRTMASFCYTRQKSKKNKL